MQTDPIFYEDNMNMYAYVGNDPVNAIDPSGMCQTDANGNRSGLCALDKPSASIISAAKSDSNSGVSAVDTALVDSGKAAYVQTGSTDMGGERVDGGITEIGGDNGEAILVTIDTSDVVKVKGVNTETNKRETRELTTSEVFEHEVVGHVQDAVDGVDRGKVGNEKNAMSKENEYRSRSGINFKRTDYRGKIK